MSSELSSPDLLPPYEIIFSCAICQKTIRELYRRPRTDHGFSSGSDQERVVTRLWLSECGHLTCNDHLEGGGKGLPFYPHGQQPSAPCPLCVSEKNDTASRSMYSIHGPHPDEHDKSIPKHYFEIPPMEMNGKNTTASALRFQYLSLLRFGGMMAKRCKDVSRERKIAEARADGLAISLQESRKDSSELRAQAEELRKIERKYAQYKEREPEIRHHLGNVAGLARENNQMKHELKLLGFDVPRTIWSFHARESDASTSGAPQNHHEQIRDGIGALPQDEVSSSVLKRARNDDHYAFDDQIEPPQAMAHPPPLQHSRHSKLPFTVYSGNAWRNTHTNKEEVALPTNQSSHDPDSCRMGGALPLGANRAKKFEPSSSAGIERPRRQRPMLASRKGNVQSINATPVIYRDPQLLHADNRHESTYEASGHQQTPIQGFSKLPAMRRPIQPMPSRTHLRQGDFIPQSAVNNYLSENPLPTRDSTIAPAVQPVSQMMSKVMESPFFQVPVTYARTSQSISMQQRHSIGASPHDQSLSGLNRMQMDIEPYTSPKTRSLNTLSFIQEPYSQSNKPVFSRPESQSVWPRAAASRHDRSPLMQRGPQVPHIQGSYILRQSAATGSSTFKNMPRQISSRSAKNHRIGFRGVKGSSLARPLYSGHDVGISSDVPRFPYQQQRALNTAGGRRSVRR